MKWLSLPYEDATWELKEDVDEGKVEEFKKIQDRPARLKRTVSGALLLWGLPLMLRQLFFKAKQKMFLMD